MRKDVQDDLIHLDIFFTSTRKTVIEEDPKFPDPLSLFSNLGGALSIWMGISFVMVVEWMELIVDVIIGCTMR